jgi:hypothetical protein
VLYLFGDRYPITATGGLIAINYPRKSRSSIEKADLSFAKRYSGGRLL